MDCDDLWVAAKSLTDPAFGLRRLKLQLSGGVVIVGWGAGDHSEIDPVGGLF